METTEYALMDAVEDRMWWYRAVHARLLDALGDRPGPDGLPWLDAGCGTGGFLTRIRERFPGRRLAGIEFNPAAAARAAQKSGAKVATGDINAMPYGDGAFGAAVAVDVVCHRAVDPVRALAELHRVLAPGGTLILNLPSYEWLRSAHDHQVHTGFRTTVTDARARLAAAGFVDIRAVYWNSLLLPLMILQRKVLHHKPGDSSDVGEFPAWLDATLHGVTRIERALARMGLRYPAGGSVMAIATRPPGTRAP
ncbi:class I SAM-dependent methyltransferase [Humitalea sp. 24SJ18S-53]|uniref:class I SAM-dependent methyltransferase n=1 Tax=Humitalea sp. 24SJ18S-53 TaxID=3422307 RepID=UPI003D678208